MASILFELEYSERPIAAVVSGLRAKGHDVEVRIPDAQGVINYKYYEKLDYSGLYYDCVCWENHVSNPKVSRLVKQLNSKLRYVIEHDLSTPTPEATEPLDCTRTIVFTKKHQEIALAKNCPKVTPARWYKLDMPQTAVPFEDDVLDTAIVPCCDYFDMSFKFPYNHLFKKAYCKKYSPDRPLQFGLGTLDCLTGYDGLLNMPRKGFFWFVRESSLFIEALMLDCLPILFDARKNANDGKYPFIVSETRITEIISEVVVNLRVDHWQFKPMTLLAVTETDLEAKLDVLRREPSSREQALKTLQRYYLFENPPTVDEIIDKDLS